MRVRWSRLALARLVSIQGHVGADDAAAAGRLIARLVEAGDGLARFAHRGRRLPELPASGLRELIVVGYRLVYRTTENRVEILTVFEGHRRLRLDEISYDDEP